MSIITLHNKSIDKQRIDTMIHFVYNEYRQQWLKCRLITLKTVLKKIVALL